MAQTLATVLADFTTTLAAAIAVGGTSATLQSATDDDGIALPSGKYFFTIDASNSQKEHIVCDLVSTALTNIKSVSRQGVQTSGVARSHRVGATVSITDFAHLQVINALLKGTTQFDPTVPLGYDGTASITTANQFATKAYADGLAIAGAGNADDTTQGLVQMASVAEIDADTQFGSSGARLVASPDDLVASKYGTRLPSADQKAAMAGGGSIGTPSTSNKYLTQQSLSAVRFGGTGADGALTITSGTTTIDCANAAVVVKNYSSISITGTGKLAFSNPATNGTTIILLCTGDITITSSATPAIDASAMGAAGGTGVLDTTFQTGSNGYGFIRAKTLPSTSNTGASTATSDFVNSVDSVYTFLAPYTCPGAGATSGGGGKGTASSYTPGSGGRGGGVLVLSCLGAYNVTGILSVAGGAGADGARSGSESTAGGGGGGAGGNIVVYYGSLTANSGTYTVSGGAGGTGVTSGNVGATNSGGGGAGSIKSSGSDGTGGGSGPDTNINGGAGANGWSKINV